MEVLLIIGAIIVLTVATVRGNTQKPKYTEVNHYYSESTGLNPIAVFALGGLVVLFLLAALG